MEDKIAIVTSGFLPVPATKGGAVENLIVNMISENEKEKKEKFLIYSIYDDQAKIESEKFKYTKFKFFNMGIIVRSADKIIHFIAKNIMKKSNSQSYRYIIQRLSFLWKISKDLKKNNYKKVLLENHPTQYLCLKWKKNYKKYDGRYYYHCHNEFPGTYGCNEIIKNTKNIICVSEYIKKTVSKSINSDGNNFSVLRNGINAKRFSKDIKDSERREILKKYNINIGEKILIFTGRFVPEKGILELVEAIKKVKYKNFKLLIIGSPLNSLNTKTEYEKQIEKSLDGIEDKVIFTGFIKYEEINKMYKCADFAVIPSIWDDPAPLTIIESLVSGLPIITTNSGGIPEYATDGAAIIIKRDENIIDNLSKSIDKLLNDEELCIKMSKIGKEVSKKLTMEEYYNNFIQIMEVK